MSVLPLVAISPQMTTNDDVAPETSSNMIAEKIIRNPMLSEMILDNMDVRSLVRLRTSTRGWDEICEKICSRRKEIQSPCYAYDFSRHSSPETKVNPAVKLLHDHGLLGHNKMMLVDFLVDYFKREQQSRPKTGFLFHGGLTTDIGVDILPHFRYLLPSDCQILAVSADSGVIPSIFDVNNRRYSSTEIQGRSQLLSAVSYLLLPDLGIDVTFFDEDYTLTEYEPNEDGSHKNLKCIIIFAKEYMQRLDRLEVYTSFHHINRLFQKYEKGFPLGGVVVDKIFRFTVGSSPSNDTRTTRSSSKEETKFTGVAFSGQNLQAASGIFDSEDLETFEQELLLFKQSLNFDTTSYDRNARTIGFLFTCSGRGPAMFKETENAEIGVVNKTFPAVLFTGVFGDGEFGENYWPKNHSQGLDVRITQDSQTEFWHFYTNVIVLLHIKS